MNLPIKLPANKVPAVTGIFWIIKILSTTVGETLADFTNTHFGLGLSGTSVLFFALLGLALIYQFKSKGYVPIKYWLVVVLMSISGTLITDYMGDQLHISLITTSIIFVFLLSITFIIWYRAEGTLSIKEVDSNKRELFYWLAILFTFALGTSSGDLIAEKFSVGYGISWLIFVGVIAALTILWRVKALGSISTFWGIYIMTRPLGAASGDFLSQSKADGGIGLGTGVTSTLFLGAILLAVFYISIWPRGNSGSQI